MYSPILCTKVSYVLIVIPWIFILLWCYTRHVVIKSFAWDDGIALAAMVCGCGHAGNARTVRHAGELYPYQRLLAIDVGFLGGCQW
jgi:hypothetical protein